MLHNFMFEEHTHYTYQEVITDLGDNQGAGEYIPLDKTGLLFLLYALGFGVLTHEGNVYYLTSNSYGLSFITSVENKLIPTDLSMTLLNKVYSRYKEHYAINITSEDEKENSEKEFFRKLVNKLDYSYDRYERLLHFYDEEKSHLLDRLSRSRSGSREVSSEGEHSDTTDNISIFNDTPQTTDVVATIQQNQYASELNKGQVANEGSNSSSGSDEFEENELFDTMTIMKKLDEVEKHYSQVWKSWLNEFDELFVEEVNF